MKRVEKESFIKSFLLFFTSITTLVALLFYFQYTKDVKNLEEKIFSQMKVCNFSLKCSGFKLDFETKKDQEIFKLYKNRDGLAAYFDIPNSKNNLLKVYLPKSDFDKKTKQIFQKTVVSFIFVLVVIVVLSVLFSVYALYPLKKALDLTQEFTKDILHDFNTPLSTIRLNTEILKEKFSTDNNLKRISNSIETILRLQENLKSYLKEHSFQKEMINIKNIVDEKVKIYKQNPKNVTIVSEIKDDTFLKLNKEAFERILDNLISNGIKYNKQDGFVKIYFKEKSLYIEDSGIGIKNPTKVFQRFYKENQRGLGIGLHIVKKLCDELGIDISIKSKIGQGSVFILRFKESDT